MRLAMVLVAYCMLIAGCGGGGKTPAGILTPEKMEAVLWDMLRTDQFLTDFVFSKDSTLNKTVESTKKYSQVLALHQVSKDDFKKSFLYYQDNPGKMKVLMDSISKRKIEMPVTEPLPVRVINDTSAKVKPPDSASKKTPAIIGGN
jgi:hypothetical protein